MANKKHPVEAEQEIVKYEIVAVNGKERNLTFYDGALIKHTDNIVKFRDAGNLAVLAIAHELAEMDKDKSYAKAGFKTVAEYAQVIFDYKPATVSLYVRAAKAFLTNGIDDNNPIAFIGNIPTITVGQMIELLPLVKNETDITAVENSFVNGDINQRMSTKEMRKAVNAIRGISTTKDKKDKEEETATDKACKLGEYNKDNLPKGINSLEYAIIQLTAAMETFDNFAIALSDVEHNVTIDAKVHEIVTAMQEILIEVR